MDRGWSPHAHRTVVAMVTSGSTQWARSIACTTPAKVLSTPMLYVSPPSMRCRRGSICLMRTIWAALLMSATAMSPPAARERGTPDWRVWVSAYWVRHWPVNASLAPANCALCSEMDTPSTLTTAMRPSSWHIMVFLPMAIRYSGRRATWWKKPVSAVVCRFRAVLTEESMRAPCSRACVRRCPRCRKPLTADERTLKNSAEKSLAAHMRP